jgi:hypothetical protein
VIGKYVLCPLRWHALSQSGKTRRWHMRAYAESELLGLATPSHAGADLWRIHRLQAVGMRRACSVAEVGLDRLVGAIGLTIFVVVSGASLPPQLLVAALAIAAVVAVGGFVLAKARPDLLPRRAMPPRRALVRGVLLSMTYQLTIMAMLIGVVHASASRSTRWRSSGVFGACPGRRDHPGRPRRQPTRGRLVVGLATLGLPWGAALGAVALLGTARLGPAILLGGGSMVARRIADRRARSMAGAYAPLPA